MRCKFVYIVYAPHWRHCRRRWRRRRRRWTINETHAKFFSTKIWTHRHRSHLKIYSRMMHGGFPLVTSDYWLWLAHTSNATTTANIGSEIFLRSKRKQWWCDDDKEVKQQQQINVYQRRTYMCSRRNTYVHRRTRQRIRRRWHTRHTNNTINRTTEWTEKHTVCAHWSSESNWNKISKAKIKMNKSEKETASERDACIRSRVVVCRSPFAVSI